MRTTTIAWLVSMISLVGQGEEPSRKDEYGRLNRQVFMTGSEGRSGRKDLLLGDQREPVVRRLKDLLVQQILYTLEQGGKADEVKDAISMLQGRYAHAKLRPDSTNTPVVQQTVLTGIPVVAVIASIMRGTDGITDPITLVLFFAKGGGRWTLVAEGGHEFECTTLYAEPIQSPLETEVWYLVHGQRYGSSGGHKRIVVYSFNGFSSRVVGTLDNLRGAAIKKVVGGEISLTFMDENDPEWREYEMELRITPNGFVELGRRLRQPRRSPALEARQVPTETALAKCC